MTKNKKKKITPLDKSKWKKLDKVEKFENKISGKWKQKGPYIINTSGKLDYAIKIGVDKHLVGIDEDGAPILESV